MSPWLTLTAWQGFWGSAGWTPYERPWRRSAVTERAADVSTLTTTSRQMNTDYSYRGILQENGHSEKKMTRKKLSEHVLWPVILYSSPPYCLRPRPLRSIIYLSSCSLQIFLFYVFITAQCCWTCVDDSNLSKHFVAIKSLFCFNSYCSAVPWDLCWFWQTVCGDF